MDRGDRYRVYNSAAVGQAVRGVLDEARATGRLRVVLQAVNWVMEELERTPSEFGESREERPPAGLALRVGFARPLYVEYAVREDVRHVYLRRFVLLRR